MGKIAGSFREGLKGSNIKLIFRHAKGIHVVPFFIFGRGSGG
jgi:hypothetical protein